MRGQCHSRFDQRIQRICCTSETKTDGKHNRKMPNVALWKLSCYKSNLCRSWNRKENFQAIRIGGLWNQRTCKNSKAHVEASLLWLFVEHGNRLCQTCLFAAGPPPSCTERTAYFLPRGFPSSKNVSSFHMILLMEGIAPVDVVDIRVSIGSYTSQVVQDFFHQQYESFCHTPSPNSRLPHRQSGGRRPRLCCKLLPWAMLAVVPKRRKHRGSCLSKIWSSQHQQLPSPSRKFARGTFMMPCPCQHDCARVSTLLYGGSIFNLKSHVYVLVTSWSVHNASDHPFMRQTGQVAHCHLLNAQKMNISNQKVTKNSLFPAAVDLSFQLSVVVRSTEAVSVHAFLTYLISSWWGGNTGIVDGRDRCSGISRSAPHMHKSYLKLS